MKKLLCIFALFASQISAVQSHAEGVRELRVGISDAYVGRTTRGADAYVVVNGIFQNGCYSWSRATVDHLPDRLHEVRTYANVQMGMCIMVLIPFTKEITLGKLESGEHRLRFLNGDGTYIEKRMTVE